MTILETSGRVLGLGAVVVLVGFLQPPGAAAQQGEQVAEGARLYGQTCARCHNPRPATERTNRDWTTIMGHMRARANLSKSDARAILAFLQATNGTDGESVASGRSAGESSSSADPGRGSRTPTFRPIGRAWRERTTAVPSPVPNLGGQPLLELLYPDLWGHEQRTSVATDGPAVP